MVERSFIFFRGNWKVTVGSLRVFSGRGTLKETFRSKARLCLNGIVR